MNCAASASPASKATIRYAPKVNGRSVRDYLDFRFQTAGETELIFHVRKSGGELLEIEFDREEGEEPKPKAKKPAPKKAPGKEASDDKKPQGDAPSKGNTSTAEIVDGKFVITTPDGKKHTRTAKGKKAIKPGRKTKVSAALTPVGATKSSSTT